MAERPVIHMIDRANENIPFDVAPYRTILFGWTTPKELEQSKEDLRAQVREVLDQSHAVDNPVIRARGQMRLRQTASPKEQEMLSMIEDLRSKMAKMQKDIAWSRELDLARQWVDVGKTESGRLVPSLRTWLNISPLQDPKRDTGAGTHEPGERLEPPHPPPKP
jgi:hypothetical protein